jgi:GNAT superfamily N-acetyltransferase
VARFSDPEPLQRRHTLDGFDSGRRELDTWLLRHALAGNAARSARTYVITDAEQQRVVGYHALAAGSIERDAGTVRAAQGMPRHPIPVVLLARLAVDRSVAGKGIGSRLLRDAMTRAVAAADAIAIRAVLVHAIDDNARAFYIHHGLEPSPTDPRHLMILIKDIQAAINATNQS